jgi:hydrogenase maturation factor
MTARIAANGFANAAGTGDDTGDTGETGVDRALDATAGITPDILDHGLADDLAAASLSLARRFRRGATMWCIAPQWEPHAHHMAVEFVHPVIVGKRALPALALTAHDVIAQARISVRPGDIVIAVAGSDDAGVLDLMRRTPAWGALSLWIGSGERPPAGAADHVLWIDDANPLAPATGRFVLLYHLLWELTHVCFEHPGLLVESATECTEQVCVTCSDEGRPAEVLAAAEGPFGLALVRTAAGEEEIDTTLVGTVRPGDLLLVHAGSALTSLSGGEPR